MNCTRFRNSVWNSNVCRISTYLTGLLAITLMYSCSDDDKGTPRSDMRSADLAANKSDGMNHDSWQSLDMSTTDQTTDAMLQLPGCVFNTDCGCWECGNCVVDQQSMKLTMGCKATNDCLVFCTEACLASGYSKCSFSGSAEGSDPMCQGVKWQQTGTLKCCNKNTTDNSYSCPMCFSYLSAVHCAEDAQGNCTQFINSCMPKEFTKTCECSSL